MRCLKNYDPEISSVLDKERARQTDKIEINCI